MILAALAAATAMAAADPRCAALAHESTTRNQVKAEQVEGLCRVTAIARPRRRARIAIELWLPPAPAWSGRYYQMGNGGFAGHIDRATLQAAARRGDAAAATDTGHSGDGFQAGWATGRRDLVVDYAWRSIKVTSDAARRLIRVYYRRPARRHYFMGCSFGGRQALVAATRWPAEWDGVIAGAPAIRWLDRLVGFGRIQAALDRPGAGIDPALLPPLIAAAAATCGTSEDVACALQVAAQACAGRAAPCLSPAQRQALAAVVRAGYPLVTADAAEWTQWMLRPDPRRDSQLAFVAQRFCDRFDGRRDVEPDPPRCASPTLRRLFALHDLRSFARRGGRVISYFGTADPVLPPAQALPDARSIGADAQDYRLFLVPGMGHCQGGPGDPRFGQSLAAPAGLDDAEHDIRHMLESWVEAGIPPSHLVAVDGQNGASLIIAPTAIVSKALSN